jgi:hypothetical protein
MVLKVLDERVGGMGAEFNSPATEIRAYESGLFEKPESGGLRAAICYGVDRREDGSTWVWLEDLSGAPVSPWPDELYVSTARHLGQFNGEWARRGPAAIPWLASDTWKHISLSAPAEKWGEVGSLASDPLVGSIYGRETIGRIAELGSKISELVQAVALLPMGVAHSDCHPRNLFPVLRGRR